MATVAAPPPIDRQKAERRFYSGMALFLVAVVLIGFGPSFYFRGIVPEFPRPNPSLTPFVILHGLLFTLWMAVFIAQVQLVSAGRRDIHMKLGSASMLLAIAMVPVMYLTSVWQVARANQPPFTTPLDWTALPLAAIPAFAYLVYQGWKRRREAQWHKRLMLGAAIVVVVGPAFGRMPIAGPGAIGFSVQMALSLLFFLPLIRWDKRSLGRMHPATWTGLAVYALATFVPVALIVTGTWAPVARYLPGV